MTGETLTFITQVISVLVVFSIALSNNTFSTREQIDDELLPIDDGYYLDPLNDVALSTGPDVLECPSSNVITTRYKCNVKGQWIDCIRKHCCKDYTYIAGRCISKDIDPCTMGLCEQHCTVYMQRVICTCFDGYKFSPENQRKGIKPLCVDVNECVEKSVDCDQLCINEIGSFRCACRDGFILRPDNKTCQPERPSGGSEQAASRDRCYANCDTVVRLHDKLKILHEKVTALSTAIRLSSYASGPPGPAGPPGPPGLAGPRGFPGPEGGPSVSLKDDHDYTYSLLDTFVSVPGYDSNYCRCKRGPRGEPGASGARGPKGEQGERGVRGSKGARGSFDFLLLLLADVRHDIVHLQNRVYANGEKPPKFDFDDALQKRKSKEKQRLFRQQQLLQGFAPSTIQASVVGDDSVKPTTPVNSEDVAEFRDSTRNVPVIDNDYSEYDESGDMTDEDYL